VRASATRVIGLCLIGLVWLLAALVVAELVARRWPRPPDRFAYTDADPILHHRLRPSYTANRRGVEFRINALGLKDREYPPGKPPGVFRILMLGDSYTEGFGLPVAEAMPKQVERLLDGGRCSRPIEVVNAGVSSYSPILEYLFLLHVGLALEPDLIVLSFDMTDVHDDWIRSRVATFGPDGLPRSVSPDRRAEAAYLLPPVPKPALLRGLDPVERLLNPLQLWQSIRASAVPQIVLGGTRRTPELLQALGLIGHVQYDPVAITRDREHPSELAAWALSERYVAGMVALARRRGIPFALVVYPHPHQVSAAESPVGRLRMGVGPGYYATERPFLRLEALGRREGIPVVNLVAMFRDRSVREGPLFFPDDMHHNSRGARVFADGVADGLVAAGLLPCH
jgi:lysophospholipase L1-like esterase